jgi:shikimate 5-dehydrogenase
MMNNENQISKKTKLFGYIGEHASVSRFSALLNKAFKVNSDDTMMIPMNIREDDFFFTLSNMKKSHVDGAIISNEYVTKSVEILDVASSLVTRTGMCDIVFKDGDKLRGDVFTTRVLLEKLKDIGATKIALIGTSSHAKAFSLMACGFQVSYFYDSLEELMNFCNDMELSNADVNRIAHGMNTDFSGFDVVLDFSDLANLDMITALAPYNFDMKNSKEYSNLKTRASQLDTKYVGYDDMIEELTAQAYRTINKG